MEEEPPEELERSFGDVTTDESEGEDIINLFKQPIKQLSPVKLVVDTGPQNDNLSQFEDLPELPLTKNLDGLELEALVGPSMYANSIIWLVNFKTKDFLDLISGDLMKQRFAPYVIKYYEKRIVNLNQDVNLVRVDLTKENVALQMFDKPDV